MKLLRRNKITLLITFLLITAGAILISNPDLGNVIIQGIEEKKLAEAETIHVSTVPEGYTPITTAEQLQAIGANETSLAGNYILINDIDMATSSITNFEPIGTETTPFTGTFDGNGYVISNLNINEYGDVGLFGYINNGTVKNIGLKNIEVIGNSTVGGLVGTNWKGTINNSYVTGAVTGNNFVGGLVGQNNGRISNSYAIDTITVTGNIIFPYGGLTGQSLASGKIISSYWVPELAGIDYADSRDGIAIRVSEIAKQSTYEGFDFENVWEIDEEGSLPYFKGRTESKITKDEIMGNVDRTDFPAYEGDGIEENPYLIKTAQELQDIEKMNLVGKYYYKIGNDIDLSVIDNFKPIGRAIPFDGELEGNGYVINNLNINVDKDYVGLFGYLKNGTVKNIGLKNIEVIGAHVIGGLVGYNAKGVISNSYATGSVMSTENILGTAMNSTIGGLVGYNAKGVISNSYATGSVMSTENMPDTNWKSTRGGLVGYNYDGTISNSYATVTVTGNSDIGGLVGYNNSGTISKSYATGEVTGKTYVGGLVGYSSSGTISKSYATGEVAGLNNVGGFVGDSYYGTINNSYSTGEVTGETYVGGLVGNKHYGTISNSYTTGIVTGNSDVGGLVGNYYRNTITSSYWSPELAGISEADSTVGGTAVTAAQMKQEETFEEWDFDTIWGIREEGTTFPEFDTATIKVQEVETNTKLSGAKIGIYDSSENNVLGENTYLTTDTRGKVVFSIKDMPAGTYTYKEEEAPIGYEIDTISYTFNLAEDNTVTFVEENNGIIYNDKMKAKEGQAVIIVRKSINGVQTEEGVLGAEITVKDSEGNLIGTVTTDRNGQVDLGKELVLLLGGYSFEETGVPEGYTYTAPEGPKTFRVEVDGSVSFAEGNIIYNDRVTALPGSVVILKIDSKTNAPLQNAEIGLCDEDGNILTDSEGQELKYMTDENGQIDFSAKVLLEPGTYYYTEVTPPAGYVQDNKVYQFTVANDGTVTFTSTAGCTIKNNKKIAPAGQVSGTLTKLKRLGGQETTTVVPGAVIGVYAEDKTTKIEELTTDENGQVDFGASQKLEALSTYYYKEEQAPAGYIKDEAWKQIVVDANGTIGLTEGNIIYNDRVTALPGSVVILKTDSKTNAPLANAEIGLCDENGNILTDLEGQELKYMTDENGQIDFSAKVLLEPGTHYYTEVTPPAGYVQDNEVYKFTVANDGTVTFTSTVGNVIENIKDIAGLDKGVLTVYKENSTTPLQGAVIGLFETDGTKITELTTGVEGKVCFGSTEKLERGKTYKYKELQQPEGYLLNTNEYTIEVKLDGDIEFNQEPKGIMYNEEILYLRSAKYTIDDNYLSRVISQTTVAEFIANCQSNGTIEIFDANGNKVDSNKLVGTGMIVRASKGNQKIEKTISVVGDLNGDGKFSLIDVSRSDLAFVKEMTFENEFALSLDMNNDGKFSLMDVSQFELYFLRLMEFER